MNVNHFTKKNSFLEVESQFSACSLQIQLSPSFSSKLNWAAELAANSNWPIRSASRHVVENDLKQLFRLMKIEAGFVWTFSVILSHDCGRIWRNFRLEKMCQTCKKNGRKRRDFQDRLCNNQAMKFKPKWREMI